MNKFAFACKTTLVAASLATVFGTAYAERESKPAMLAQAQTEQGAYGNTTGSSGASGTSGAGMDSAQPGQTSGASTSGAAASGTATSPSQDPDPAASTSGTSDTSGAGAAGKGQAGSTKQAAGTHPPVYLLMPVDVAANDNAMKQGCWARVYDRENFTGDMLTVVGPAALADMDGPFGLNWDDRVNSIETGPKATVTVYDNENFRDQVSQFKPGQRVADLSRRLGFFDEFASIRIDCQQG